MILNAKGFSLTNVLIASGMLGLVSLGSRKLMQNTANIQSNAYDIQDQLEMLFEMRNILNDQNACRVSLAGSGPLGVPLNQVTFQKSQIDQDNEGLEIELWKSDKTGNNRSVKKFSAIDPEKNKFRNLTIKSMKLIMPNNPGQDYPDKPFQSDIGKIRVTFERKNGVTKTISSDLAVTLGMKTTEGVTTILSCSHGSNYSRLVYKKNNLSKGRRRD